LQFWKRYAYVLPGCLPVLAEYLVSSFRTQYSDVVIILGYGSLTQATPPSMHNVTCGAS